MWPLLAVAVIQAALVAHTFPWQEILSATPILYIDHPFHLYQVAVASAFGELGRLTGYDPFFAAGHVGGVTFNGSAKAPALIAWLLRGWLTGLQSYKLFIVTVAILAPVAVAWAAVLLKARTAHVWSCGAFAIALWWASGIHWYYAAGMVSFVAVAFFTIPYCVALGFLVERPRVKTTVIVLGIAGALLFMMHPFFVCPLVFFCAWRLLATATWDARRRFVVRLCIIGAICLLPNLPWLLAMRGNESIGAAQYAVRYQMAVDARLVWMELLGISGGPARGAKVNILLAVLAVISLWQVDRTRRAINITMIATWASLVLFAAFGAALPFIGSVQPNRFSTTAYLFLCIPAAAGLEVLFATLRTGVPRWRYAGLGCAAVLGIVGVAVANEVRHEVSYAPSGRYAAAPPEVRGLGPKGRAVLDWIRTDTTPAGRILFENSFARVHDGGHIVGYLQMLSGREFIGGPYNNFFAGTRDGWMFGRPLNEIDPKDFAAYLRLYNIGWIVVHSDVAKHYLRGFPGLVESGPAFEGLETFVVHQKLDFVEQGSATIRSIAYGKLVIEQRGAAGAPIVLKYHDVPGLHAVDGSPVEPVLLMDDPTPFIRVTPRSDTVELVR